MEMTDAYIIVDIDTVIADRRHRIRDLENGDIETYHEKADQDVAHYDMVLLLHCLSEKFKIIGITTRSQYLRSTLF